MTDKYPHCLDSINKKTVILMMLIFFFTAFHLGMAIWTQVWAQKVKAEVTVILEKLPEEKQERLQNFYEVIQNYINGYRWTEEKYDVEINLALQLLLEDISASSEDRYRAQLLISNKTDIQYFDKRARFEYQKGEMLIHSEPSHDSLTSLLDFYIYLVLGGEFDKYGHLEGTPYFEKAKVIAEQAKFGLGRFVEGWDLREELIKKVLGDEYKKFREMKDYYFYGIYLIGEDDAKARKFCSVAVDMIEEILKDDPENKDCKQFLSAHYIELIDLFKDAEDRSIFDKLIKLDPDHEKIYREYLQK